MHKNKAEQGIYSFPINRQAFSHLQKSRASLQVLVTWEEKHRTFLPSFFSQLYMLSTTSYGLEYPCGQLGSAVSAVSPPSSFGIPSQLPVGAARETEKALTMCKHCSATAKTSLCYLLSLLIHCSQEFFKLKGT